MHQINPKLGRLVSREEAHQHVEKCRDAGLVHMVGRTKLDVMWLGAGPGEKLMTICSCCPCCCLSKVLPEIAPQISAKVNRLPGVSVVVNDNCLGCGDCTQGICFVDAIQLVDDRAQISENCRGCGQCVEVCPIDAIELSIQEVDYVDHAIQHITQLVDVN